MRTTSSPSGATPQNCCGGSTAAQSVGGYAEREQSKEFEMKKIVRLHPYNRQVILFNRWAIPYAPAYGWIPRR